MLLICHATVLWPIKFLPDYLLIALWGFTCLQYVSFLLLLLRFSVSLFYHFILLFIWKRFVFWEREYEQEEKERIFLVASLPRAEPDVGFHHVTHRLWPELKSSIQCPTDWATQVPLPFTILIRIRLGVFVFELIWASLISLDLDIPQIIVL